MPAVNLWEAKLSARLVLVCHAATPSMRTGGFASPDEPLDEAGVRAVARLQPSKTTVLTSPALAARQTAAAFGEGAIEDALRDIDHGAWTGRTFAELDPAALVAWLADPAAGAPGGEPLAAVVARLGVWLAATAERTAPLIAVTHPMVIRAALAAALELPPAATLRIDIAPLSQMQLSFNRVWRLQGLTRG